MADKTYDINISGFLGGTTGGAGGQKPSNSASIDRLIKGLEALVRAKDADIAKDLKPLFENLIRQLSKPSVAGPSKISQAEIKNIANEMANEMARQMFRNLTKVFSSVKQPAGVAGKSDSTILNAALRNSDKQAQALIGGLASMLSRKGINIDPKDMKSLESALTGAARKIITTKSGAELRELSKAVSSMKVIASEIGKAVKSVGAIRKSGGGIDITEIKSLTDNVSKIGKEFKNFKGSAEAASNALKRIPDDVKNIKEALADVKRSVSRQVGGVRERAKEDPQKFARLVATTIGNTLEKSPAFRQSDVGKSWKGFEKTVSNMQDVTNKLKDVGQDISKFVKTGQIDTASINKLIDTLSKNVVAKPPKLAPGWYAEEKQQRPVFKEGKKQVGILKEIVKVDTSQAKKEIDTLVTYAGRKMDEASKNMAESFHKEWQSENKKLAKAFDDTFKAIEKSASARFSKAAPILESLQKAKNVYKEGDVQSAMHGVVKTAQIADMPNVIAPLEKLKEEVIAWTDNLTKFKLSPNVTKKWMKAYEDLSNKTKEVVNETEDLKKEAVKTKDKFSETTKAIDDIKKNLDQVKTSTRIFAKTDFRTKDAGLAQEERVKFLSSRPQKYADETILPGVDYKTKSKQPPSYGKKVKEEAEETITNLSSSLDKLQKDIISDLEKGFKENATGWNVLDKKFEKIGNQWKLKIANIDKLTATLGENIPVGTPPTEVLRLYEQKQISKTVALTPLPIERSKKIGEWLKNSTMSSIDNLRKSMDSSVVDILKDIKSSKGFDSGEEVGSKLAEVISNKIGKDLVETVFEKTYAKTKVQSDIVSGKLSREVTLPAAERSTTGGAIFKTKHGSERAIPKFATYTTGFEALYDELIKRNAFKEKGSYQEYASKIENIGFRPEKTGKLKDAKKLATDLFTKLAVTPEDDQFILEQYKEAATMVGAKRQRAGTESIVDFEKKINKALEDFKGVQGNIVDFVEYMENFGVSAYDVVKSMQSIKFENVYDIYNKVLKGTEGTFQPIKKLAEKPQYDSSIREYEQAMRSVEQLLPVIEPGRVKRGKHYESTATTMFQKSPLWQISSPEGKPSKFIRGGAQGIGPEEQKQRIQDINMNLREYLQEINELYKTGQELTPQIQKRMQKVKLPSEVRTISTLGPPEAQAASYEEYRPAARLAPEQKYLKSLDATAIKLYTDKLLEQAPFGEFGRIGRNIANVTGAMGSGVPPGSDEGVRGLGGLTSQFPSLRTTRERDIISSGRYGQSGYGFNVLAELKHSAATFEDQIIISGKLADALTQAVSNLVKPSAKGRLSAPLGARGAVTPMKEKTVRDVTDKEIKDAARSFMEILGVPEKYKKDADKALIENVKPLMTTIRGEDVEVQKAKLVEVFMTNFARKFVTRYGTKGVSVKAAGPEGLGTAEIPKSMGELGGELVKFIESNKELMKNASRFSTPAIQKAGFENLRRDLVSSGNKFMLDIFSDATNDIAKGLGVEEEIKKQAEIYERFTKVISNAFGIEKLPKDIAGISKLKELYSQKIGPEGLTTKKPIEIRISAAGIAKRGLQAEFLESIMGNIIGIGEKGKTTIQPTIPSGIMKELLGTYEQRGVLSKYSKALGYTGAAKPEADIRKDLFEEQMIGVKKPKPGAPSEVMEEYVKKVEAAKILAEKGAALEAMSSYYTKIKDEYGKAAKSIVGPKFVQIVEEPHQTEGWSPQDVEGLQKGGKLNLPAMSAYSTIFGEQSALMEQIKGAGGQTFESKKLFEYIKSLQALNTSKKGKELAKTLMAASKPVELTELKPFEEHTGTFFDEQDLERSLKGTILDIEKYTTAMTVQIPKGKGKGGELEREPFYIPGPLARQTYPEELIAGEVGMDIVARRLQTVINKAIDVERATGKAGGTTVGKDLGEMDALVRGEVAKLLKETHLSYTKPERRKEIYEQLLKGLDNIPVEEAYREEAEGYPKGISEKDYIKEFENRLREKYKSEGRYGSEGETEDALSKVVISRIVDVLIGPRSGNLKRTPSKVQKLVNTGDVGQVKKLAENLEINKADEKTLDKKLEGLNRAKIEYMRTLTDSILGKTGAIAGTTFLRKTPAVMAKAISAVTDKTKELKEFSKQLRIIGESFGEFASDIPELEKLDSMASIVDDIRKEHAESISKYKGLGIPVLGQHELGVPKHLAKKIPVTFEKRYDIEGGMPLLTEKPKARSMRDSNLAAMIEYKDALEKGMEKMDISEDVRRLKEFIDNELTPYIESVRYPFTGISSVQPYKAKLLPEVKTKEGRDVSKYALAVPGVPEMRLAGKEGFSTQIKQLQGAASAASDLREKLYEEADRTGALPEDKISRLTNLIDALNKAISEVIPKYIAVQQKLDYDGDMIQIHSGTLAEARKDIEKHYKSMTEYTKGMGTSAQAWRDVWTAGETTPGTSKEYPLADIMTSFEKKWSPKKGYEFLKRPELTEKLDFMPVAEQLNLLGTAKAPTGADQKAVFQSVVDELKSIVEQVITEPAPRSQILDNINNNLTEGNKTTEDLLAGIQELGQTFESDLSKLVTSGIKDRLYEQKYSDAIVAQLYKLHTGQQTEGIYRLHRVAERRVGFGPGVAGIGEKGYRTSPEFAKRWPSELKIFGSAAPESEIHTFINELERFATQKGMDVKHAGARPVAGEITESLSRGTKGVETLIEELNRALTDKESEYAQLSEFSEASKKAIESRLGRMTTDEIMSDIKRVTAARGLPMPEIGNRKQAMAEAVKLIGFEGFLRELALQIEEDAVNAFVAHLESLSPRARNTLMGSKKGMDLKQFAEERVKKEMGPEGSGIKTSNILKQTEPLYGFRAFGVSQKNIADQYRRTSLQTVEIPSEMQGDKKLEENYRNAQEVSRSIQRTLQEVNQIKGGGTYNDLVISTLENIYDDQTKLESILNKLKSEGYPVGEAPGIETLGKRMFTEGMPEIPSITKDIIAPVGQGLESAGWVLDDMKNKVDEYSRLAGVAPLGPEVKRAIEYGAPAEEFTKKAKERFKDTKDEIERGKKVDKYVENMIKKASAVAQMDKVIATLKTKVKERDFITRLLPSEADLSNMVKSQIESDITKPARDLITEQARRMPTGRTTSAMEEQPAKPEIVGGSGGAGREALTGGVGPTGEAVPVFIVGVAEGIGLTFTPAGVMQGKIDSAKAGGSEDELKKMSEKLSELHEKAAGVSKTMRATYEDVFRASALSGGGRFGYKGETTGPGFRKEQVAAIKEKMMDKEKMGARVKASSFYGTVLHKQIQDMSKKQLEEQTGGKKTYDVERLVEYQDALAGYISGHADLIEQQFDDAGEAVDKKVIDIKTVSKGMVERFKKLGVTEFKDISKMAKEGGLTNYDIKKLNDVASQLNLYIKAVAEANDVAEGSLKGEAWFYDRDDLKNMAKIEFDFDPDRLERDMKAINEARESIMREYGSQGFAEAQHRLDLTRAEQKRKMGEPTLNTEEWASFSDLAKKYWGKMEGRSDYRDYREDDVDRPEMARSYAERARRKRFEQYDMPKAPARGGAILDIFANLKEWHDSAKEYAEEFSGIGFDTADYGKMVPQIKGMLEEVKEGGPKGTEFFELLNKLQDAGYIQGPELARAWKYYRIAVGDFFLKEAERASAMEEEFKKAGKLGAAGAEYGKMRSAVNNMKKFIEKGLGKATDIYTSKRRYVRPDLAEELGLYLSPRQLMERSQSPLETDKLRDIFEKRLVGDVTGGKKLTAPIEKVRGVVKDLSGADEAMVDLLTDAEKFSRMGDEVKEVWNLDDVAEGVVKLKYALQSFLKFKFQEGEDLVERKNLEDTIKLLNKIGTAYTPFRGQRKEASAWGEMNLTKVPGVLPPKEQEAMHMRNLQRVREYFTKTEREGGAKPGERYTYQAKVIGEMGDTVKTTAYDFKKLGDAINFAGEKVGLFKEKQRDLMEYIQGGNRTFSAAIMRAVRWGAASKIVYGGWQKIWDSIGVLADIETGIAKLRMVMSPLETDFDALSSSAVKFAKQYGTSIQSVLDGMKIFAQQGLSQAEVIDRTRVSTLAANVTTLSAKEATEALTAAMKVYGQEGESAMRFLDAWSEVEARHAITAGDMANAIKKTASAAKNAGITFDELNGLITGIGAVTRQSGREIATGLRFIFRRLYSEEAPKELAKINIPVLTGGAELRKGYDVLNDLAMSWKDLTSAQKMNIAQALGGVRQYNSLLVLMDNWKEANEAVKDSVNSKGSAERRNLELMKTYTKQLAQTKAAAVEVQMAFGKVVLPSFKTGLTFIKTALELFSGIPTPVKAAMAAVAAFLTYVSKGESIINKFFDFKLIGSTKISDVIKGLHDEFRMTGFEVLGKGAGESWAKGLKTVSKYSVKGLEQGKRFRDFHTALGKTKFLLMDYGQAYNKFLGNIITGGGNLADSMDRTVQGIGKSIQKLGTGPASFKTLKTLVNTLEKGAITPGGALKTALGFGVYAAGKGMEEMSEMVIGGVGDMLGTGGRELLANWASANTGVVKSLLPLITTMGALYFSLDKAGDYFSKITQNSKDFENSMYGVRRASDAQIKSIRDSINDYDKLSDSVAEYNKMMEPKTIERRKQLGTYQSPLLKMEEIYKNSIKYANKLAESNINLVSGYDEMGNAILRNVDNYRKFSEISDKVAKEERARAEVGIASRFAYDLSEKGGAEKWKSGIKKVLKELPLGFGSIAANLVKVTPAKAIEELTMELNKLLSIKNKFPMSTVVDEDVKRLQKSLKEARILYDEIYTGFKQTLANIQTEGLDANVIADIFSAKDLRKGFEVSLKKEAKYKPIKGLDIEDLIGAEVLKGISPKFASYIDATAALTRARLESSIEEGVAGIEPTKKLFAGRTYLATFPVELAKKAGMGMAGGQAIIEWRKNIDGMYEAVATYFNKKTLKIEKVPFSKELQEMAEAVFPVQSVRDVIENSIDQFNEFVAGAGAGLRGISAKDFKKDFSLGERFFSGVPTTTLLQGEKGYTPGVGYGAAPLQQGWTKDIKKYFFEPMQEYSGKIKEYENVRQAGLETGKVEITPGMTEKIVELQNVLKNNQIVFQYRAVWVDMTKAMAENMRVMKEAIAVERERLETVKVVSGELAGISEDLIGDLNLGIRQAEKLTPHQVALKESPAYITGAKLYKDLEQLRKTVIGNNEGFVKAKEAVKNIKEYSDAFGVALQPDQLKDFAQQVAILGDKGAAAITLATNKVVDNTAMTNKRLEDILVSLGDPEQTEAYLTQQTKNAVSASDKVSALEKLATRREYAQKAGDTGVVIAANKQIDVLSKSLAQQVGMSKAIGMVEDNITLLNKDFKPEEFLQRALPLQQKEFYSLMRQRVTGEKLLTKQEIPNEAYGTTMLTPAFFGWKKVSENMSAIEKDSKGLYKLQEESSKKGFLDSKTVQKAQVAASVYYALNKKYSNDAIKKYDEQIKVLETQAKMESSTGDINTREKRTRSIVQELEKVKEARSKEQSAADLYGMVRNFAALGLGATTLARTFGFTEKQIKGMGLGAMSTYLAFQLLSSVTNKEVPESVKEFGKTLKEVGKVVVEKGNFEDISVAAKAGFKRSAAAMMEDVKKYNKANIKKGEQVFEGLDVAVLQNSFEKTSQSMLESQKKLEEYKAIGPDYKKYAEFQEKQMAERVEEYKKSGFGGREYEDLLAKQNKELFNFMKKFDYEKQDALTRRFPVEIGGKAYYEDVKKMYSSSIKEQGREKFFEGRAENRFPKEFSKLLVTALATTMAGTAINEKRTDYNTRYAQAEEQAKERLSIVKKHPEIADEVFKEYFAKAREAAKQGLIPTETVEKAIDTVKEYATQQSNLDNVLDKGREKLSTVNNVFKTLNDVLASTQLAIGELSKSMIDMAKSLKDLSSQEFIETLTGIKEYRDETAKLFGGGHPEARVAVSVEQERQASVAGIKLTNLKSTKYDVEKAMLQAQAMREDAGPEIYQKIQDIDEQKRRDVEAYKQTQANKKLLAQTSIYEKQIERLGILANEVDLSAEMRKKIEDLQNSLADMLADATDMITQKEALAILKTGKKENLLSPEQYEEEKAKVMAAGPEQYRGVQLSEFNKLRETISAISKAANEKAAEDMKQIVENTKKLTETLETGKLATEATTQTQELQKHTGLLEKIVSLFKPGTSQPSMEVVAPTNSLSQRVREYVGSVWDEEKQTGGRIFGPGGPKADKVPAMLSSGEYVIKTSSAQKLGYDTLEHMNKEGTIPGFAEGGMLADTIKKIKDRKKKQKEIMDALGFAEGGSVSQRDFLKMMKTVGADREEAIKQFGGLEQPFVDIPNMIAGAGAAGIFSKGLIRTVLAASRGSITPVLGKGLLKILSPRTAYAEEDKEAKSYKINLETGRIKHDRIPKDNRMMSPSLFKLYDHLKDAGILGDYSASVLPKKNIGIGTTIKPGDLGTDYGTIAMVAEGPHTGNMVGAHESVHLLENIKDKIYSKNLIDFMAKAVRKSVPKGKEWSGIPSIKDVPNWDMKGHEEEIIAYFLTQPNIKGPSFKMRSEMYGNFLEKHGISKEYTDNVVKDLRKSIPPAEGYNARGLDFLHKMMGKKFADGGAVEKLRAIGMSDEDIKRELGGIEEPLFGPGDIIGIAGGATKLALGLGKGIIKQAAKKPKTYEELLSSGSKDVINFIKRQLDEPSDLVAESKAARDTLRSGRGDFLRRHGLLPPKKINKEFPEFTGFAEGGMLSDTIKKIKDRKKKQKEIMDALGFAAGGKVSSEEVYGFIKEAGRKHNLDPELLRRMIGVESDFDPRVVSKKSAIGLAQVLLPTAQGMGYKGDAEGLKDPRTSIMYGAQYLREQIDRFGSIELGLAAYNAGPNAVEEYGGIPPFKETKRHIPKVLKGYKGSGVYPKEEETGTIGAPKKLKPVAATTGAMGAPSKTGRMGRGLNIPVKDKVRYFSAGNEKYLDVSQMEMSEEVYTGETSKDQFDEKLKVFKSIKKPVDKLNLHQTPNLIKQLEEYTVGPGFGIPKHEVLPEIKPEGLTIPGIKVGPESFAAAEKTRQLREKYGDWGELGLYGLNVLVKKASELPIIGSIFKPNILSKMFDKIMGFTPKTKERRYPMPLDVDNIDVPTSELDKIAKGSLDTVAKDEVKIEKEDWAIKTAEGAINRMKKAFTTEEYEKNISSFYSDNVLKQMFTNYIDRFGKDGYKQAMLDLNLQSPDPHIFSGAVFGTKGPVRKRYNPFQTQMDIEEGKYNTKELKHQWDLAKSKQTMAEAREKAGSLTTGLTGKPGDLVQYQSKHAPGADLVTKDMLKSVEPKKSGASIADPIYAKMVQDQADERQRLMNNITTAIPGSPEYKNMQNALKYLDEMVTIDLTGKNEKKGKKEYNKKYKNYSRLMEAVADIKTITPDSELYNSLQSQEKMYVQMHLRAKSMWDTYEDTLKDSFKGQGLDYKGKDKELYEERLKARRDNVMKQLLYTNMILAKIRTGEDYTDLQSPAKYRSYDGTIRAFKDRWGRVQPRPITSLARKLDRDLIQQYSQEKFETDLGKTFKGTGLEAQDVYAPGFPPEYLKELKGAGFIGRRLIRFKNWIRMKKSLEPDEMGMTKKELLFKRLREYYDSEKESAFPGDNQVNSMKVLHNGGIVSKTGPVFAQKGEVFFPKGLADGGLPGGVSKLMEKELPSLRDLVFKVDTTELKELLNKKLKVEDIELKVEDKTLEVEDKVFTVEDKTLEVEDKVFTVEDKTFSVEDKIFSVEDKVFKIEDSVVKVDNTTIKIDAGAVVSDIAAAVKDAVSNIVVKVEASGGAVGADEFANISEAVNNVNDKLIALNRDIEDKINMLGPITEESILNKVNGLINDSLNRDIEDKINMLGPITEESILNKVNGLINDSLNNAILEVRTTDNVVDNLRSEVQREKDLNNYRMSEIDRKIGEIYNVIL